MDASRDEVLLRRMLDDLIADQPPAPPDRYRAVRHRAIRNRWNRASAMLAVALAITGAGLGVRLAASGSGSGPVTIRGILEVSAPTKYFGTSCPPPSAAPGVPGSARVTVQDPSGAIVGRAKLGSGIADAAGKCLRVNG
jgi:hypothetical protein